MTFKSLFAALAILLALAFGNGSAFAQVALRTFVSGSGADSNPCSLTSPCKSFAGAISKTMAGGEITCLDSSGYGALMITKSISIVCPNVEAGILVNSGNGLTIAAGASDVILLSGLDIEGAASGTDGINIQSAGSVVVTNCIINNFSGDGIIIATNSSSRVLIRNSIIGANADSGVVVNSTPGFGHVRVFESMIEANTNDGIQVNGAGNDALISNDEIVANYRQLNTTTGVSGGVVYSLANNVIPNSSGDNPTPIAAK